MDRTAHEADGGKKSYILPRDPWTLPSRCLSPRSLKRARREAGTEQIHAPEGDAGVKRGNDMSFQICPRFMGLGPGSLSPGFPQCPPPAQPASPELPEGTQMGGRGSEWRKAPSTAPTGEGCLSRASGEATAAEIQLFSAGLKKPAAPGSLVGEPGHPSLGCKGRRSAEPGHLGALRDRVAGTEQNGAEI